MELLPFNSGFIEGTKPNQRVRGTVKDWLKNEILQQCLKKARCQRGIFQPLEGILTAKESELPIPTGDETQFETIELGGGFFAIVDCVNRIVRVNGWTELGMFKFELCLAN